MKKDIFDYRDYKAYLKHWMGQKPMRGRGLQSQMARVMGCQTGYLSQVLNSSANLSLEQGEALNEYLGHTQEEKHFFILLIEWARAGTQGLKKHFQQEIEKILNQRLILKDRFDIKKTLDIAEQNTYYSSWYYAAIHIALSVPGLQTRTNLSNYLGLSPQVVADTLDFLLSVGLAQKNGDRYSIGVGRLFLGKDSPMIKRHHSNWRLRAMQTIDTNIDENLHFSTVVSLSRDDLLIIKEKLVKAVDEARSIARDSEEECVTCLNLDFFELKI